jgi:PAS domain S-box-containing protein
MDPSLNISESTAGNAPFLRVLHLEDDLNDREVVRAILAEEGFRFEVVYPVTLPEFENALESFSFDLIFLDYNLPSCDGMTALTLAREKCPQTPSILLSGTIGEEKAVEIMKSGATDYVLKRHLQRLGPVVRRALREAREWAERRQIEEALRKSEARLTDLIDIAIDTIVSIDENYRIEIFNKGAEATFGYRADEVIGKQLGILLPERFAELHDLHLRDFAGSSERARLMDGRTQVFGRRKDGSEFPAEASISKQNTNGQLVFTAILRDITERKQVEAALGESADRYRVLFESMDEGYCVVEMIYGPSGNAIDYRFVEINPAFEKHTGLQNALGKTIREMVPNHDAHWFEIYGKVARTGEPIRFENPAEAMHRYYDVYAFRIGGPGSPRLGILFNDITARKRAEETLRENQLRLELAMQASKIGPWDWNLLTGEVYFSPEWKRQIGYADAELPNQPSEWENRLHPEDHDRILSAINAYRNNPSLDYDIEFRFRHKDGSYRWIHSSAMLIPDANGNPTRIMGCHADITYQKKAIDRLFEQASLLDKAQDAILVRDIQHRITYWNKSAGRLYGWSAEEALGSSVDKLLSINPQAFRQAFDSVMQNGEWIGELQKVAKDGRTLMVEARWTVVYDSAGQPQSILDINTDITDRRSLEEQLRQAQKMEAVGKLAGGVAHDFNNLLTIILGHSQLMAEHVPEQSPLHGHATEIRKAGERAAGLTKQLLAFSRKQVLQPRVLNINSIVKGIQLMLHRLIGEHIELVASLDADLGRVKADPVQIEQIILNLAVNGRDAMPQGGKLIIETRNTVLDRVHLPRHVDCEAGDYVVVSVTDTGSGIDPETIGHIFEPFFTTKGEAGTGLGLSTVYGIVKQSGGFITVDSKPREGTTFTIYLPRVYTSAGPDKTVPAQASNGHETILLVEDEASVRELARKVLERSGYTVLTSKTTSEALELSRKHRSSIDLLLTDVIMPGHSGPELAEQIVRDNPGIKVLFMSGYMDDTLSRQQLNADGVQLLEKPFSPDSLTTKVHEVLHASSIPSLRVLVVDDEEGIRSLVCGVLEKAGHHALPASHGVDAWRLLKRLRFDIVITDLTMPYRDGIELIMEIRREWPDVKIIAISGRPEAIEFARTNFKDVPIISKPLRPEDLLAVLEQVALS